MLNIWFYKFIFFSPIFIVPAIAAFFAYFLIARHDIVKKFFKWRASISGLKSEFTQKTYKWWTICGWILIIMAIGFLLWGALAIALI